MKILSIFAHPDDEILAGWPVIQDSTNERSLLVVCDNKQKYPMATRALSEIRNEGIKRVDCLNLATGFYRIPFRHKSITFMVFMDVVEKIKSYILKMIAEIKPDYLYTHNPMGEYGHGDHKLLFSIVASLDYPMLFSDICMRNKCHFGFDEIPRFLQDAYYDNHFFSMVNADKDFYRRGILRYKEYGSWSWNEDLPNSAILYRINNG